MENFEAMRNDPEILIVEDSPTQAAELLSRLEENGFRVTTAIGGQVALAAARANPPALVISDILMPGMDGFALCHAFKSDRALAVVPFLLLTTLSDTKDIIRGLAAGADLFLSKPCKTELLLSQIRKALERRELAAGTSQGEPLSVTLAGEDYTVCSSRIQILSFLLTTYENAVQQNQELLQAKRDLQAMNERVEADAAERAREDAARMGQLERELRLLTRLSVAPPTSVTAELFGSGSLAESLPDHFQAAVKRYGDLLDHALEQRAFKVDYNLSEDLRVLGERLGFLKAGPRDVVEVHTTALKSRTQDAPPQKARAMVVEGRLTVLELMGNLAAFYRAGCSPRRNSASPPAREPEPKLPITHNNL